MVARTRLIVTLYVHCCHVPQFSGTTQQILMEQSPCSETSRSTGQEIFAFCEKQTFITAFFVIKPNRCTNFKNLFCHETLHVSDSSSFHHSFSILSDDRSKASSKTMPPYSAMQSLLLQMRISSPVLKVIQ